MSQEPFRKVGHLKDVQAFADHVASLGVELPCDDAVMSGQDGSPLAQTLEVDGVRVGNRWCIQPMEGWDGTAQGEPTERTLRRWRNFGLSGAKLIWGGEAFAVQEDARANPNQIGVVGDDLDRARRSLERLLATLVEAHRQRFGKTDDLLIGLQLTHSGRYCKPYDNTMRPQIAYHHPLLDARLGIDANDDSVVLSDDQVQRIIENYIRAAKLARDVGFHFVDVKHCHGYLGHEFLSAFTRKGKFGGSLEYRTRFAREIIAGIQSECPGLMIGVRFSAFDYPPFKPDRSRASAGRMGPGVPEQYQKLLPYVYGFGCRADNPLEMDLGEPVRFVKMLAELGVRLINVSCGSPYYNPHVQRPAMFPPSDGYDPPEDPLVGVARQIRVVRQIKSQCPDSIFVGSGYTYLQEYLPNVAQAAVRRGWVDSVGVGRLVLTYWDMPADVLDGNELQVKRICRTFSDCTTGPRSGLVSGCYPLDPYYRDSDEGQKLKQVKLSVRRARGS